MNNACLVRRFGRDLYVASQYYLLPGLCRDGWSVSKKARIRIARDVELEGLERVKALKNAVCC